MIMAIFSEIFENVLVSEAIVKIINLINTVRSGKWCEIG